MTQALGDYDVVRLIAKGGMGAVFEVASRSTGARYAAKTILNVQDVRAQQRFRREAELLARCDRHPGVVKVHAFGQSPDGAPFMILDLVSGEGLDQLLAREGRLESRRAALLVKVVAEALGFVHELGIVHRDVKPSNVLLDESGAPRLTDFGLATARDMEQLTRTGQFLGTIAYCSPEQATGAREAIQPASDVFSAGAVLHHALAGEPPYAGRPLDVVTLLMTDAPVPPLRSVAPHVPPSLAAVVDRALEKCPALRYANGRELAADLARYLEGRETEALRRGKKRRRRRLAARTLVAGVALAACLGLARGLRDPRLDSGTGPAPPLTGGPEATASPAQVAEARGDALARSGNHAAAVAAYTSALDARTSRTIEVRSKRAGAAALAGDTALADREARALVSDRDLSSLATAASATVAALGPLAPALYSRALRTTGLRDKVLLLEAAANLAPEPESLREELARAWLLVAQDESRHADEVVGKRLLDSVDIELVRRLTRHLTRVHRLAPALGHEPLWAHLGAVRVLCRIADAGTTRKLVTPLFDDNPDDPAVLAILAETLVAGATHRGSSAIDLVRRGLEHMPAATPNPHHESLLVCERLAESFAGGLGDDGRPTPRDVALVRAAAERCDSWRSWIALARVQRASADPGGAWASLARAVGRPSTVGEPPAEDAIERAKQELLFSEGRSDQAVQLAEDAYTRYRDKQRARNLLTALRHARRYARAEELFPDPTQLDDDQLLEDLIEVWVALHRDAKLDATVDRLVALGSGARAANARRIRDAAKER